MKRGVLLYALVFLGIFFLSRNDYVGRLMISEGVTDPARAWKWVAENIKPVREAPGMDVWQPAEITAKIKTGDCEDYTILLGEFLHRLDHDSTMQIIISSEPHAILNADGVLIEPQKYGSYYPHIYILAEYTYEEYTKRAKKNLVFYK